MITQQELRRRLHYDPDTGIWTWLVGQRRDKRAGRLGGNSRGQKYWYVYIKELDFAQNGKSTTSSHLAYFYMTGRWPDEEMDHINNIAVDDRWQNLRPVTRAQNEWNKGKYRNNKSGAKGVYFQHGKWVARIRRNGIRQTIGNFLTPHEAAAAYQRAASA
jgi:hypothetical protein